MIIIYIYYVSYITLYHLLNYTKKAVSENRISPHVSSPDPW